MKAHTLEKFDRHRNHRSTFQLVEPLQPNSPLQTWLNDHGEGLHHVCFGVDDVETARSDLNDDGVPVALGSGRGRVAGFVTTATSHGVAIECTKFVKKDDVDGTPGWLNGPG